LGLFSGKQAYTLNNLDSDNKTSHDFPLAAVDLNAWMHGAKVRLLLLCNHITSN
jgi:hypothetical protein